MIVEIEDTIARRDRIRRRKRVAGDRSHHRSQTIACVEDTFGIRLHSDQPQSLEVNLPIAESADGTTLVGQLLVCGQIIEAIQDSHQPNFIRLAHDHFSIWR